MGIASDIRQAVRQLTRKPGLSLAIVATLALGIGVNAAVFGVVDLLFLRPPAVVRAPDSITRLYVRRTDPFFGLQTSASTNFPWFAELRDAGVFDRAAAVYASPMSLGRGPDARRATVAAVSHEYFPLLGVSAARGRVFGPDEDRPGGERVAVLSDAYWRSHFGGDTAIIGRPLALGAGIATVIGVTPRGFGGLDLEPVDLWIPINDVFDNGITRDARTSRGWVWMSIVARLRTGQRAEAAAGQATAVYRRAMSGRSAAESTATVLLGPVQQARGPEASSESRVSAWIALVAALVLLIACANVANLLLVNAVTRRREMAVRVGLGAGRPRLIRMLLAESLVLAGVGGAAALLLASWVGSAVRAGLVPDLPADLPVVDTRVLLFTGIAVLVTAVLAGLVPALQASRIDVAQSLKAGGHGSIAHGSRTRTTLLVAQVALTIVLLAGAGLFVRSLRNVQHIDLGFDADRVLEASVDLNAAGIRDHEADATYLRMLDRIGRLPGVAGAAATMSLFDWGWAVTLRAEGRDSVPRLPTGGPYINVVTPGYFAVLGMPLTRGRGFTDGDVAGAGRVAVINATMARQLWPERDAVGRCLYIGTDTTTTCTEVVGIVGDAKRGSVTESPNMLYYVPLAQFTDTIFGSEIVHGLVVRSRTRAGAVVDAVRREMQASGDLPYASVTTLADRVAPQYRSWRLGSEAFSAFGALALFIAALGIFAVVSYGVQQRTQEIGVRMALGARPAGILRLVLGQGLRAVLSGVVVGAAGAVALGRGMAALLFGVSAADPLVLGGVAAVLIAVAVMAAWLPARRAAAVDPMIALRVE